MRKLEIQRLVASNEEPVILQLSKEDSGTMLQGTRFERVAKKTTRNEGHKIKIYGIEMKYPSQEWDNETGFRVSRGNYNGLRIMK